MMTEQQRARAAVLKSAVAAAAGTPAGTPVPARDAAIELARDVVASGGTAQELAAMIGVHPSTLSGWKRDAAVRRAPTSRFREVRVESAAPLARSVTPAARTLRVAHAPSGLVIDGLDVETLAALLRSLA